MAIRDLAKTLTMPDPNELKAVVDEEDKKLDPSLEKDDLDEKEPDSSDETEQAQDPSYALKTKEEYTWKFSWRATPKSRLWTGSFTNKILNQKERTLAGQLRARFGGGMPYDSLDPLTNERNLILAHLSYSLVKKPEWLKDMGAIQDLRVLQEIYMEVASHEAIFLEQ